MNETQLVLFIGILILSFLGMVVLPELRYRRALKFRETVKTLCVALKETSDKAHQASNAIGALVKVSQSVSDLMFDMRWKAIMEKYNQARHRDYLAHRLSCRSGGACER